MIHLNKVAGDQGGPEGSNGRKFGNPRGGDVSAGRLQDAASLI
jgi:hypothetical protein